ncbi:ATP-binding protein [Halorussus halophilus]|uniref:ATP-binding protein n=1 Tax=Halorussus halophilus TaxID=2650975 RepID=UPI00374450BA
MFHVLGRTTDDSDKQTAHLGSYRARDGSPGATVHLDLNRPHAGLLVGKRGYGKSYTLGVLAEELVQASGVAPVVADPMGVFESLADLDGIELVSCPRVVPDSLAPRTWCDLLGLDPDSPSGTVVWRAAAKRQTLAGMREFVAEIDAPSEITRAADNHLELAASWGVFDSNGVTPTDLLTRSGSVLDLSGFDRAPANAVVSAVARGLYQHCVRQTPERLPWLLLDEAHTFFGGVAETALRTVLTRGRQPGVSFVAATQRPSALPEVAISQADLLVAHRLTSRVDLDALAEARPTYVAEPLDTRLPERPGEVVVVDDATESTHALRIRERETPHGGAGRRAAELS